MRLEDLQTTHADHQHSSDAVKACGGCCAIARLGQWEDRLFSAEGLLLGAWVYGDLSMYCCMTHIAL